MPIMGWVAIGLFFAGVAWAVVWYLVQRRVTRIDALEAAVFGETGVRSSLKNFITQDHLKQRLDEFRTQLLGVSEEGMKREERILAAIERTGEHVTLQMKEVREDVRSTNTRIDALFTSRSRDG